MSRQTPTSRVFHRDTRTQYPLAVQGDGPWVVDAQGKRYLDACGGAAVSCLGHSHAGVIEAVSRQAGTLAFAHSSFFTNEPMEALAAQLVDTAPLCASTPDRALEHVYFVSGGSEAVEAALKLARQYFVERGEGERHLFVARRQSYHGNTLGALAVGGNAWRREPFAPLLVQAQHIAPCYEYRGRQPGESALDYGHRVANELEQVLVQVGPRHVIAFVAETVVGATLGAVPAVPGYFKRVREICDHHGILLILDEVMCGMGRTGTLHAYEQEGITPDLLCIAKGLGAGYQPIGAVLVGHHIYETVRQGSGFFQHGHTYLGHPVACAAALAVQRALHDEGWLAAVTPRGEALHQALVQALGEHPHVGDIRGRGLFRGVELVTDRTTQRPFDPGLKLHARIKREAMACGLMCYPMGGTLDGRHGDHVLLAPPFIIDDTHIAFITSTLRQAIDAAITACVPAAAA